MAKFTASRKGQPHLVDTEGYEYTKHRNDRSGVKIYWRCSKYKSLKCPARATTEGNYVINTLARTDLLCMKNAGTQWTIEISSNE